MFNRLLKIPHDGTDSVFLLGPRGTGKTYWLKMHFKEDLYLDLLDTNLYTQLLANPTLLESFIPPHFQGWVIIDEVQKIPELLNEVHRLIEHKQLRFILTGSSARSLRRKGTNLLAGRALSYTMHPLTAIELGEPFDLAKTLQFGLLPKAVSNVTPKHYLETYINTYIREEVLQEGLLRNLGQFYRFLEVASFSQGGVINYSEIAREASIDRKAVADYFDILEDLLIGLRLPVFAKRAKRRLISHPKFYFFDVGVYRIVRPQGPLDSAEELDGPGLETLFLQNTRAINDYLRLGYEIYYWQTSTKQEVDFVLYGNKGLFAFELKRKKSISKVDLRGLKAFMEDYPMAKCYLLYGGDRIQYMDNITIIPFKECLFDLIKILSEN